MGFSTKVAIASREGRGEESFVPSSLIAKSPCCSCKSASFGTPCLLYSSNWAVNKSILTPLVLVKKPLQRCLLALRPPAPAELRPEATLVQALASASAEFVSSVETLKKRPLRLR